MIRTEKIAVTTTGNNGAATGTGYSSHALNGELQAICVDWGATAPATSDIDIVVEADDNHPQVTLYDKDDSSTDAWVYPVVQRTSTAGAAVDAQYQAIPVAGRVKVSVAGCNALSPAVTVYLYLKE